MLESLQQADQQLILFLNSMHAPFWDHFMWIVTAKLTWVPMYAAILYVLCKNLKPGVCIVTVIAIALTITYADQVCATLIRPLVERWRPSRLENGIEILKQNLHLLTKNDGEIYRGGRYGFPSCHAANSFALAFLIMLLFKNRVLTFTIMVWAILNSYSRIYIGVHYPGDILAGMIVGLSGALIIYYLYRFILNRPGFARRIRYDSHDKLQIEHIEPILHTRTIIYTALFTVLIIAAYSLYMSI